MSNSRLDSAIGSLSIVTVRQKQPNLILLDINMPGIDGLTVCQTIREHITYKNLSRVVSQSTQKNWPTDMSAQFIGSAKIESILCDTVFRKDIHQVFRVIAVCFCIDRLFQFLNRCKMVHNGLRRTV